jgi:hypothetical protein
MNCAEFEACLNEQLDGSHLGQAADLAEHAAHCPTCRATREGYRLLRDGIAAWRREIPDVDLAEAVVFGLKHSADRMQAKPVTAAHFPTISRQRRRRSLALAISGAAALVIVTALIPVLRRHGQSTVPVVQSAATQRDLAAQNGASIPQLTRRDALQPESDRVPYYDLAQRAAGALDQMTMLVLPGEGTPQNAAPEPPAERPAGWIDDVEDQLKPVGRSLGNAFDFLWRAGESADG